MHAVGGAYILCPGPPSALIAFETFLVCALVYVIAICHRTAMACYDMVR